MRLLSFVTFSIKSLLRTCSIAGTFVSVRRADVFDFRRDPTKEPGEYVCPRDVLRFHVLYNVPEEDDFDSFVSFRVLGTVDCIVNLEAPLVGRLSEGIKIKSEKRGVTARQVVSVCFF